MDAVIISNTVTDCNYLCRQRSSMPTSAPGYKSSELMLLAEGACRIYDPIHFPEEHTAHPLIQILKDGRYSNGIGVVASYSYGSMRPYQNSQRCS